MEVHVTAEDKRSGKRFAFYYESGKLVNVKAAFAGEEYSVQCLRDSEGRLSAIHGKHPSVLPPAAEFVVTFEHDKKGKIAESKTPSDVRAHRIFFGLIFVHSKGRISTFSSAIDPEYRGRFLYGKGKPASAAAAGDKLSAVIWDTKGPTYFVYVSEKAPADIDLNEVGAILALF